MNSGQKKAHGVVVKRLHIVLMPKDPVVLLLKPLKHSVWNTLVPHPVMRREEKHKQGEKRGTMGKEIR